MPIPTLKTARLILRPFATSDAPRVQQLAGAREIADTTATIPHPYPDGLAEEWIGKHAENFDSGKAVNLAITLAETGELVGAISLMGISRDHARAELGYWIGVPYWNRGYCTEAAAAVVAYGFAELGLNRITSHYFVRNPASGRVLEKIGMVHEGLLRQHLRRWDRFEDCVACAILRSEFRRAEPNASPSPA
jgi:ribosomal-protein-alanine N-acetyltransferase